MYTIITTTENNRTFNSNNYDSLWATNLIAISFVRNNKEVVKAEIINNKTGEIERTYIK